MPDIGAARPVAGTQIIDTWGQNVHDAVESVPRVIAGAVNLAAGSGVANVPFNPPFASTPSMVATAVYDGIFYFISCEVAFNGANISVRNSAGAIPSTSMWVSWIASEIK